MVAVRREGKKTGVRLGYEDLCRVGPGTLCGRYLRRFWHPVYRAQDLPPRRAVPLRMLGEDLTLHRGEGGAPHVVAYRCAHRGTQLSVGWVEGDRLRCRYHGWKYDASGQCVEAPAEPERFARTVRIRAYPTEEYLGLIFAYLGDGDPPPFPTFPEFEETEGLRHAMVAQVWHCNFLQRLDNNGDTVHVPFTHAGAHLSADARAGIPEISKEESPWGTTSYARFPGGALNVFQFGMPNIYWFVLPSPYQGSAKDERIQWMVPIDDEHSIEFRVRLLHMSGDAAERYRGRLAEIERDGAAAAELGEAILAGKVWIEDIFDRPDLSPIDIVNIEDYAVQVGQGRVADRARERLGLSDVGVAVFRRIWERELRALAEGRPIKQWTRPPGLVPRYDTSGH